MGGCLVPLALVWGSFRPPIGKPLVLLKGARPAEVTPWILASDHVLGERPAGQLPAALRRFIAAASAWSITRKSTEATSGAKRPLTADECEPGMRCVSTGPVTSVLQPPSGRLRCTSGRTWHCKYASRPRK